MESTAMTAEQQSSKILGYSKWRLAQIQQAQKQRKKSYLPLEGLRYTRISSKIPLPALPTLKWGLRRGGSWLHPFHHSGELHAPELWTGPAFPPGAQSLVQAMTQHFHYNYLCLFSHFLTWSREDLLLLFLRILQKLLAKLFISLTLTHKITEP